MNHRGMGERHILREAMRFAWAPLLSLIIGSPYSPAHAGEFDRAAPAATTNDASGCNAGNHGPGGFKASGDCRRISGYIAAGARFGTDAQTGAGGSLFRSVDAPEFVGSVRRAAATIIEAPVALGRLVLPYGASDEAR